MFMQGRRRSASKLKLSLSPTFIVPCRVIVRESERERVRGREGKRQKKEKENKRVTSDGKEIKRVNASEREAKEREMQRLLLTLASVPM